MRNNFDRKLAAAGERDEDAGVPLVPVKSLLEALKPTQTSQRSNNNNQPVKQAPKSQLQNSGERRVVDLTYHANREDLDKMMSQHSYTWLHYMTEHARPERQIVAAFGRTYSGSDSPMSWGVVDTYLLSEQELNRPFDFVGGEEKVLTSDRTHVLARQFFINRHDLLKEDGNYFTGIMLEVGFWSRLNKQDKTTPDEDLRYLGKIKLHFPQPYTSMVFYLDLSHTR